MSLVLLQKELVIFEDFISEKMNWMNL